MVISEEFKRKPDSQLGFDKISNKVKFYNKYGGYEGYSKK